MNKEQLISEMLLLPITAIDYHMSQHLLTLFPNRALVEGKTDMFNPGGYAAAELCTLTRKTFLYNQMSIHWRGPEPEMRMNPDQRMVRTRGGVAIPNEADLFATAQKNTESSTGDVMNKAWFDIEWQDHTLDALFITIEGYGVTISFWDTYTLRIILGIFRVVFTAKRYIKEST